MNLTTNPIAAGMGLQFTWIEANLLGVFLADVGNSRGNFDEIKEKFAINPAPIASQSSLNARGSQWTRDLPQNFLNSFTNQSKVSKRKRIHRRFKERFRPKIKVVWCGRELESMASWGRFDVAMSWLVIWGWMPHDRAMIEPRSRVDRGSSWGTIHCLMGSGKSGGHDLTLQCLGVPRDAAHSMRIQPYRGIAMPPVRWMPWSQSTMINQQWQSGALHRLHVSPGELSIVST